ncbi:MAG: helix-turn-helix domain-containing protein [Candidatus Limnocylindria bacterium]
MINAESLPASRQQVRDLTDALRRQPKSFVQALIDAVSVEKDPDRHLDREIWGAHPSARRVRAAAAQNLSTAIARRQAVLDDSVSRRDVATALGKSDQAVSAMLERQALVGLKLGREWRIPRWQMAPGLATGIVPGVRELATAYLDGVVSLAGWVQLPNPDLGGMTPRDALLRGAIDDVIASARTA